MNEKQRTDLSKKLTSLQQDYQDFTKKENDLIELIKNIRNPGWTTPAEHLFAVGLVDAMQAQAKLMQTMHKSLMAASSKVVLK